MKPYQNPLMAAAFDPEAHFENITQPLIHHRKRNSRREIRDLRRAETAADALTGLDHETEIYGLTKNQFSLIDVMTAALAITGPAHLCISTWTAAKTETSTVCAFMADSRLKSCRILVDLTFQRRAPGLCQTIRDTFGPEAIRISRNHAKLFVLTNDDWQIVCMTSMNLNWNPRNENFLIRHDPDLAQFHTTLFDDLWKHQHRNLAAAPYHQQALEWRRQ